MAKNLYNVNFKKIEEAMWETGFNSFFALCRAIGMNRAYLSRSKKKGQLGMNALSKIAKALKKPVSFFLEENQPGNLSQNHLAGLKSIPVFKHIPSGFAQEIPEEKIITRLNVPGMLPNSYAILAKEDNMTPLIKSGDFVIFIPDEEIQSGDIVVVNNEWGESSIKCYREKNGKISFESDNPEYAGHKSGEKYQIMGKVVDIWRNIKP